MAEFCKECFIELLRPSVRDAYNIQMSKEACVCEGCGELKQFVLSIKDEPFCPFVPAYCDVPRADSCIGCDILKELTGGSHG